MQNPLRRPRVVRTKRQFPPRAQPLREAPPDWQGSIPEYLVDQELQRRGYQPGIDYVYQSSAFGGRQEIGGKVPDFQFSNPPGLVISVVGEYYHFEKNGGIKQEDTAVREMLAGLNLTVIFIEDRHALQDIRYYVGEALQFRDHSRLGRG